MKDSHQDRYYREVEGDAFFKRTTSKADPSILRPKKQSILRTFEDCGLKPKAVLEYGCNYADLLNHMASGSTRAQCVGVEASEAAVRYGREQYGDSIQLHQGTIADNPINNDSAYTGYFDLVIIDDVFCWVSRETLYQSIANVDDVLSDGGYLFVREFFPRTTSRNRNHHVDDGGIYCHKTTGLHAGIFLASGMYEIISRRIFIDDADQWANTREPVNFDSRWADTLMRKSFDEYYDEHSR